MAAGLSGFSIGCFRSGLGWRGGLGQAVTVGGRAIAVTAVCRLVRAICQGQRSGRWTVRRREPDNGKMKIYPISGNQNAEQVIVMMDRLQREIPMPKIAFVLDNAGFHHAGDLTKIFESGEALDRITPIYLPPYAPDHNPTEHVWNAAKGHISNVQRSFPEGTFSEFMSYGQN